MKMFLSDNNSGVHPRIMEALIKSNEEHAYPYGDDRFTKALEDRLNEVFGREVHVTLVATGTGANVIGISALLRPYEAVVCSEESHIAVDETGAFERFTGSKVLTVPHYNGKIRVEDIKRHLAVKGNIHHSQAKVISIAQITEFGTVYTVDEIKELADFAHENDMFLHVDGARLANGVVAMKSSFKEMIADTGVDLLSFGGTKNGMIFGEAIISFNEEVNEHYGFIRKQGLNLVSKMRYIAAQFLAYLEDDLWKTCAKNANEKAQLIIDGFNTCEGIHIYGEPEANIIFAYIPNELIEVLQEKSPFHVIVEGESKSFVRIVTSFDTTEEEIKDFLSALDK
ncbi:threonine aldolase family protein [Vallitalea okinawensis]|uniref:threonine aldolase family protein n=1 Tax=Vallitalea okinawensis TaxID=2078660 RepID=UPI000CFDF65F|nr:aminotransferase class I/II-fold pyridoxal phosphate-dependent enzyme [Vallitalea okinawensis]